jgi:pimeloyl-ACP methyl ester carboxylesterase
MLESMTPEYLTLPDRRIAYQRFRGHADKPGIVFMGGFASDMTGTKATFLAERCAKHNLSFLRFDYRGHGQSDGEFRQGTIGAWFDDAREAFNRLTEGPQIVVGSSMGGWMALMLAIAQPERVHAIVGIAAAPDFTEDLMWARFTPEQRLRLVHEGEIYEDDVPPEERQPITLKLIEDGRKHLLLHSAFPIRCPMRLLQGMRDADVPWEHAARIVNVAIHDDVQITLVKDGDHRLSRPQDLELLWRTIVALVP